MRSIWLLLVLATTACGGAAQSSLGPRETLAAYGRAVEQGRVEDAWALLSTEARRDLPLPAFRKMLHDSPAEAKALGASLARPAGAPQVTATVTAPSGETLLLVLEDGEWRVDGSAVDLYSQATPARAVLGFVRAFRARRWDVLLRFVPDEKLPGLDAKKLATAWEGEQKADMEQLVTALEVGMPSARFEEVGEHASMEYGAGSRVELLRERGRWKIEDFK